MDRFGLIGKNIGYSFSRGHFTEKFQKDKIQASYENFDLDRIEEFEELLKNNVISGLNVTIPYKESIMPFLDEISKTAKKIGAVNTIRFKGSKIKGYNTDQYGFRKSLKPLLKKHHRKALILGTGGASKAICYSLDKFDIGYKFVSRTSSKSNLTYEQLDKDIIDNHHIIINCTPLGTYPEVETFPPIPYDRITKHHLLYDLVYNPAKSMFLQFGEKQKASIKNGLEMLELQAEKAWEIWNR